MLVHGLATTRVIWRRVVPLLERSPAGGHARRAGLRRLAAGGPGLRPRRRRRRRSRAALDRADVGPSFDLVGHSMGGARRDDARRPPAGARAAARAGRARPGCGRCPRRPRAPPARSPSARSRCAGAAPRLADLAWGRWLLMTPGTAEPASIPPGEVRAMLAASHGATRIAEALATVATADLRGRSRRSAGAGRRRLGQPRPDHPAGRRRRPCGRCGPEAPSAHDRAAPGTSR